MYYSRPPARKNSKRENHSQHICKAQQVKKRGEKAQLIFVSKDKVKVNQRRKFLLIFFQGPKGSLLKKTALLYHTLPPKCTHPFFHVDRKGSVKQGKSFLKC